MTKASGAIFLLILLVISFFVGVVYSNPVKKHYSWVFESDSEDAELPKLSNKKIIENTESLEDNSEEIPKN